MSSNKETTVDFPQTENKKQILLQTQNLSLLVGERKLLSNISLTVSKGEIVTVIGPNGAGKTTLLRVLLGLIPANSGSIFKKPKLRIGYLPQKVSVDPILPLSVSRIMNLTGNFSSLQIENALEETGVDSLKNKPVFQLSGGEFQRVMLARALLRSPELLVLDEPVQGVDYMGESELYNLIGNLRKSHGCGVLMVSHDLHVVMASTDRVLCLNQHICCEGQPEDVSRHPEYLRLFGLDSGSALAIYSHHHDHTHHLSGDLQEE
ncbi:MAG TPA: zinc ABC transporter ATP-binding protein ZnuC [Candidatus Lambdaproteobacteria bacterium]|nr:zinc ABC transporter ATP-binding protein ZnuC [Deltaproteobacteria bacterium]HHZ77571.1 zinc ABC transporter ATP-binding protein ZnuC [Candidatus Lambdaproteobacteria bacterium]HIA56396.1 zinc ABC transporter ATP-binding protein ZnuC [Candidatus Lambdaproteobacteria bacterium]HIB44761.1 zinc ABC transporter ATP-binding protein ZnuC [Candidatus Lambdaproteobacteria bacterium]HIB93887.1 zinc ABC transporter ATP-binding protein ZnuC [Candidatus Lambdaproteobacteria bacterium]